MYLGGFGIRWARFQRLFGVKIGGPAIDYGIAMEHVAKKLLEELGYDLRPCGLFLDPETLGIGATPDAWEGENGVVEIKCPYTAKDLFPKKLLEIKDFTLDKQSVLRMELHI